MLDALKFVKGGVSKNSLVPELTHFRIEHGAITGFNGVMALSSPIDLDITACPKADIFFKAVDACKEATSIEMMPSNRLRIKSGAMTAYVPCIESTGFAALPQGSRTPAPEGIVEMLSTIEPFVGEDASRPWAMGALLNGPFLYATNNICLVQYWTGLSLDHSINVPSFAVREILRAKEQPTLFQTDGNSLTIHYESGRWIRTQLLNDEWPYELIAKLFESTADQRTSPIPEHFVEAVEAILPFVGSKAEPIYFRNGGISTSLTDGDGVSFEVPGLPEGPCFNAHQITLLAKYADSVDWTAYPRPCLFFHDRMRGVALGRSR